MPILNLNIRIVPKRSPSIIPIRRTELPSRILSKTSNNLDAAFKYFADDHPKLHLTGFPDDNGKIDNNRDHPFVMSNPPSDGSENTMIDSFNAISDLVLPIPFPSYTGVVQIENGIFKLDQLLPFTFSVITTRDGSKGLGSALINVIAIYWTKDPNDMTLANLEASENEYNYISNISNRLRAQPFLASLEFNSDNEKIDVTSLDQNLKIRQAFFFWSSYLNRSEELLERAKIGDISSPDGIRFISAMISHHTNFEQLRRHSNAKG